MMNNQVSTMILNPTKRHKCITLVQKLVAFTFLFDMCKYSITCTIVRSEIHAIASVFSKLVFPILLLVSFVGKCYRQLCNFLRHSVLRCKYSYFQDFPQMFPQNLPSNGCKVFLNVA